MDKETTGGESTGKVVDVRGAGNTEIIFEMPECGGCRTCGLNCSFHHSQTFTPSLSSIKILGKEEGPGYRVSLVAEKNGMQMACDGCKDLDVPLCVEYCQESDDLMEILIRFEERKTQNK